jgi:hypothetical protein
MRYVEDLETIEGLGIIARARRGTGCRLGVIPQPQGQGRCHKSLCGLFGIFDDGSGTRRISYDSIIVDEVKFEFRN